MNKIPNLYVLPSIFAITLSIYFRTLYPTIAGGDSGELIGEACHLGVAHPPGYPTYIIIYHLFMKLFDMEDPGWCTNLLSAILSSCAACMIYLNLDLWTRDSKFYNQYAIITAPIIYSFSPLIWRFAIDGEVFAMNNLFNTILIYQSLKVGIYHKMSDVNVGALLCGFFMTNQQSILFFEIPLILWILYQFRNEITINDLIRFGLLFLVGLLPYFYLIISDIFNPKPFIFGAPCTFEGFFYHILRKAYGTFQLSPDQKSNDNESMFIRLEYWIWDYTTKESLYIGPILVMLGIIYTYKEKLITFKNSKTQPKLIATGILSTLSFYLIVFHMLSNISVLNPHSRGVISRFWQQPNILMFHYFGIGLSVILSFLSNKIKMNSHIICCFISALLIFTQLKVNYKISDKHDHYYFTQYAKALLSQLPNHSIVFLETDLHWMPTRYLTSCEGYRMDEDIIKADRQVLRLPTSHRETIFSHLILPNGTYFLDYYENSTDEGGYNFTDFLRVNQFQFPGGIYIAGLADLSTPLFKKYFKIEPFGIVKRIYPVNQTLPSYVDQFNTFLERWHSITGPATLLKNLQTDENDEEGWEASITHDYWDQVGFFAGRILEQAMMDHHFPIFVTCARILEEYATNLKKMFYHPSYIKRLALAHYQFVAQVGKNNVSISYPPTGFFLANNSVSPYDGVLLNFSNPKWLERSRKRSIELYDWWMSTEDSKTDKALNLAKKQCEELKRIHF